MEGYTTHRHHRYLPLALLVLFLVLLFLLYPKAASETNGVADEAQELDWTQVVLPKLPEQTSNIPRLIADPTNPNIATHAAVLIDADSGTVLYADRPQAAIPIASTTKLMTAILTRAHLELDQVVTVTKEQTAVIGSDMELRPGERITVRSLLAGLLLASGNDAAWVLAQTVSGSNEEFVKLMNAKAADLGLARTRFADPAGLDDEGHSTAFELSVIARAAFKDPVIAEMVRAADMTVTSVDGRVSHQLKNSNRLVGEYQYAGALGFKTGYTPAAGHCLVAGAERNGHLLIAVVLRTHADTITASADEARKLLDWGWQNTIW